MEESNVQDFPPSVLRHWRPHAQRNLRNQFSKLSSLRHQWVSASSSGRSHATSLVNSYLSIRYMDDMDLGVLSDLPNIRKKAHHKLLNQQELQRSHLVTSYKSMLSVILGIMNSSRSMRCFLKSTSGSPLLEFSSSSVNSNDTGDAGGAPVVSFLPISAFEIFGEELLHMFKQELLLKRLLVVKLLCVTFQKHERLNPVSWLDEIYDGEADDLSSLNLYSKETSEAYLPKINGCRPESGYVESDEHPSDKVLEVYLTTWLAEVNIDAYRMEEIFNIVGEELRTSFS